MQLLFYCHKNERRKVLKNLFEFQCKYMLMNVNNNNLGQVCFANLELKIGKQ